MKSTLLFFVKFGAVLSEIVLIPSNTAVIVGEKMDMNCLTTNHSAVLKWSFYNSSRTTSTIYRKGSSDRLRGQFAHFGIEINANGPVKLSTTSTRSSDAGIYTCQCEIDGKDAEYSAHLIVIESLPVCESNLTKTNSYSLIDGDYIWIQCSINFRGFWAPSMEWIQHGPDFRPEGKSVTDGFETVHSPIQRVTSKLTIEVNSLSNGSYFTCKIYFAKYSNTEVTTANNVPTFTYTWNSSVLYYTSHSSTQAIFTVSSSATEISSCVDGWLTALNSCILVLSICVGIVTISICIVNKRKSKSGATEKAEGKKADSNPDDYENVITNENSTIEGFPAATYMELTSTTKASQPVYTSIDITGKKRAISSDPSPVYETMTDM